MSFWARSPDELGLEARGLSSAEAAERLRRVGPNLRRRSSRAPVLRILVRQFATPIVFLLLTAAVISLALGGASDGAIILGIVAVSGLLGFFQETGAARAMERLYRSVESRAAVLRDGAAREVPFAEVVPGDLLLLDAGALVPADALVIEAHDLHVDEASLTGETWPAEKTPGRVPEEAPLAARRNSVFCGTHVVSGTGRALAVLTGGKTLFGEIAAELGRAAAETEFEHGLKRFGYLLVEVTLLFTLGIFAVNVQLHRPALESLLFAVALAVGLTPQLLPAIVSVNLAHGARRMAKERVIVRRLAAIESFGSMTMLCTDKTGTLTEPSVHVEGAFDAAGAPSPPVLRLARVNAQLHAGFPNPIDDALRAGEPVAARKLDDVPYDFVRKRLSVLVELDGERLLIVKGACRAVLAACPGADGAAVCALEEKLGRQGLRTIAVASRPLPGRDTIGAADERDLTFAGVVAFAAPLKPGAADEVKRLAETGVQTKMLTGDSRYVAAHVAEQIGLQGGLMTGTELEQTSERALAERARRTAVFAELEPRHKLRLVRALRAAGEVVGFLGDGVNDAPALHSADVGISVDGAADVAREAADLVLLDKDLAVLQHGVAEGRRTFANTLKYVFMATSANFGNMFSMALASLFLPFLPLLPKQVLLTNLLTDLPEMTIAGDRVDPELVERPRRWDVRYIRRFMISFGLLSSAFDFLTFAVLRLGLGAGELQFRTGWFVESVISASLIVLAIRTRRPLVRSRPGKALLGATAGVVAATALLPLTPLGGLFGFVALPGLFWAALAALLLAYVLAAELLKRVFYRAQNFTPPASAAQRLRA